MKDIDINLFVCFIFEKQNAIIGLYLLAKGHSFERMRIKLRAYIASHRQQVEKLDEDWQNLDSEDLAEIKSFS